MIKFIYFSMNVHGVVIDSPPGVIFETVGGRTTAIVPSSGLRGQKMRNKQDGGDTVKEPETTGDGNGNINRIKSAKGSKKGSRRSKET